MILEIRPKIRKLGYHDSELVQFFFKAFSCLAKLEFGGDARAKKLEKRLTASFLNKALPKISLTLDTIALFSSIRYRTQYKRALASSYF